MSEWPIVKLGELLKPSPKKTAGELDAPILSITMHDGLVEQGTRFKKRIASLDTSIYRIVFKGQLVVGFPIDEGVLDFQDKYSQALVSPAYGVWDLVSDEVTPEFLGLFLKSPRAISIYKSRLRGTTARRRSLPTKVFQEIEFPLPPLGEQKRIAEILGKVSKGIQQVEGQLKRIQELSLSVVDNFVKNELVDTQPLYELVEFRGGSTPSRKNDDFWDDGNIRWFTSKDLKLNELVDSIDHVTESAIKNTALKPVSNIKAIAISLRGMSLAHRVPMSVIPANSCVNQDLKALIPKAGMDVSVIFALLKREEAYLLTKVTTSAHGTKKLDFPHVKNLQIPKLSSVQISKIKLQLEHINQLNHLLHRKLSLLQELQKSLATRTFAGLL